MFNGVHYCMRGFLFEIATLYCNKTGTQKIGKFVIGTKSRSNSRAAQEDSIPQLHVYLNDTRGATWLDDWSSGATCQPFAISNASSYAATSRDNDVVFMFERNPESATDYSILTLQYSARAAPSHVDNCNDATRRTKSQNRIDSAKGGDNFIVGKSSSSPVCSLKERGSIRCRRIISKLDRFLLKSILQIIYIHLFFYLTF